LSAIVLPFYLAGFLALRMVEYAIAKLCFLGFPAANSAFKLARNAFLDADLTNGMLLF
jgi:hypothetical protein